MVDVSTPRGSLSVPTVHVANARDRLARLPQLAGNRPLHEVLWSAPDDL
jgi:hypothetical protein